MSIEAIGDTNPWHPKAGLDGSPLGVIGFMVPATLKDLDSLRLLLVSLPDRDQELLFALYWERKGVRQVARELGIYHRAVVKRRDRILRHLREAMNNGERVEPNQKGRG